MSHNIFQSKTRRYGDTPNVKQKNVIKELSIVPLHDSKCLWQYIIAATVLLVLNYQTEGLLVFCSKLFATMFGMVPSAAIMIYATATSVFYDSFEFSCIHKIFTLLLFLNVLLFSFGESYAKSQIVYAITCTLIKFT